MAFTTDNIILRNLSGGFGKQVVFRQRGDKTIMAKWPTVDKDRIPTPDQAIARANFREASRYASAARKVDDLNSLYEKLARKDQSPYHAALSDAMKAPTLSEPNVQDYKGKPGQALLIKATDNYMVASVQCSIITPDGEILESGEADQVENESVWVYIATKENASLAGSTIRFIATDIPRNETEMVITL